MTIVTCLNHRFNLRDRFPCDANTGDRFRIWKTEQKFKIIVQRYLPFKGPGDVVWWWNSRSQILRHCLFIANLATLSLYHKSGDTVSLSQIWRHCLFITNLATLSLYHKSGDPVSLSALLSFLGFCVEKYKCPNM